MIQPARRHARFPLRFFSFVAAGLALGCGSAESVSVPPPTAETASDVLVCNDWTTIEERELYVLSGIYKKLSDYPEFAAEIGVESVSTCEEARAFMQSYFDYSERHPGFDADQPLGPIEDMPPPPSGASATLETQKLIGGTSGFFGAGHPQVPVVRLRHIPSQTPCTGTFIAKNWITTAAHCLAEIVLPPTGPGTTRLKGYTDYRIDFASANGTFMGLFILSTGGSILQLPDPRWMGDGDNAHDFALLFLDKPTFDPMLPNPADGAAMRVLSTLANLNAPTFISGTASGELRTAQLPSLSRTAATFNGTVQSVDQALCSGDSGGPLFQRPLNPPIPVLLGTLVGTTGTGGPPLGPGCPGIGQGNLWTRLDKQPPVNESLGVLIETFVEKWIGKCKDFSLPGGATASQCWGDPCQLDTDCPQTPVKQYCSKPHRSYAGACPICDLSPTHRGTCECIQGQCLPSPVD